jgi:hypothetical protein
MSASSNGAREFVTHPTRGVMLVSANGYPRVRCGCHRNSIVPVIVEIASADRSRSLSWDATRGTTLAIAIVDLVVTRPEAAGLPQLDGRLRCSLGDGREIVARRLRATRIPMHFARLAAQRSSFIGHLTVGASSLII